jgi:hypothetical protein
MVKHPLLYYRLAQMYGDVRVFVPGVGVRYYPERSRCSDITLTRLYSRSRRGGYGIYCSSHMGSTSGLGTGYATIYAAVPGLIVTVSMK